MYYLKDKTMEDMVEKRDTTDDCYLVWSDWYLRCIHNHKIGEDCLMHQEF